MRGRRSKGNRSKQRGQRHGGRKGGQGGQRRSSANRSRNFGIAEQTQEVMRTGNYVTETLSVRVEIRPLAAAAAAGTEVVECDHAWQSRLPVQPTQPCVTRHDVWSCTTLEAMERLVKHSRDEAGPSGGPPDASDGPSAPVPTKTLVPRDARALGPPLYVLNFASAKNPGGGWLGGAQAQEETLARSSTLYECLTLKEPMELYYAANKRCGDCYYTDTMVYSPDVPFFKNDAGAYLVPPYCASVVTVPAVNAGVVRKRDRRAAETKVAEIMERRMQRMLQLAWEKGYRTLVLGAWGCGVFRNAAQEVATLFHRVLQRDFVGCFERIVWAIYDRPGGPNITAWRSVFGKDAVTAQSLGEMDVNDTGAAREHDDDGAAAADSVSDEGDDDVCEG